METTKLTAVAKDTFCVVTEDVWTKADASGKTWQCVYSGGENVKRRDLRVQVWVCENGATDVYIGKKTPYSVQYQQQIENAYAVCAHSAHASEKEHVLRFHDVATAVTVLRTWVDRYGKADSVKDATKDKANSVMSA
jgi:hypothetical protein